MPDSEVEDHHRIFNRLALYCYSKKRSVFITPSGGALPLSEILPPELAEKYHECYDELSRFIEKLCGREGADADGKDCEAEFMMGDKPATARFAFEEGGIRVGFL